MEINPRINLKNPTLRDVEELRDELRVEKFVLTGSIESYRLQLTIQGEEVVIEGTRLHKIVRRAALIGAAMLKDPPIED